MDDDGAMSGQARSQVIANNLAAIQAKIPSTTRLVAVSKTFSVQDIQYAYDAGQKHFGENYLQELLEKQALLPRDIEWHYIGALQGNKLKALLTVPNLTIETLDSPEKARKLNSLLERVSHSPTVNVFIQVNTSEEEEKRGIAPGEPVLALARLILNECSHLRLVGLMTIGSVERSHGAGVNPEFDLLAACRQDLSTHLGLSGLELSMGMSADFEQAVSSERYLLYLSAFPNCTVDQAGIHEHPRRKCHIW